MRKGSSMLVRAAGQGKRFAIMGDIHANLEASQAVLADARGQGCDRFAFLGDFVGYYADPKACVDIVRGLNAPCVRGNHDDYCAGENSFEGFNPRAARAIRWTRAQLSEEDRAWLRGLPLVKQVEEFTIVHATLDRSENWGYVFDKIAAAASLQRQTTPVCFFGHTHVPVAFVRDSTTRGGTFTKFEVEPGKSYFVNPGAVGQPRDNNLKAAYAVFDVGEGTIELRRCEYDIETARRKVEEAGLMGD